VLLLVLSGFGCERSAKAPAPAVTEPGDGVQNAEAVAPDFTLPDLAGGDVSLAALRGRPVVIDFWATWCAPCERQIPVLNAFHDKHGDRIPVLGIAVDVDGAASVSPFVERHGLRYRVLLGDEGLAQEYDAFGFPTLYVIRPDGTIHSAHVGVVSPEALEAAVSEWARGAAWRAVSGASGGTAARRGRAKAGSGAGPLKSHAGWVKRPRGVRLAHDCAGLGTPARASARSSSAASAAARPSTTRAGGRGAFVIQTVGVELIRSADGGRRVISRHGPGDFFGEMSVLLGRPRMARAVALVDTCVLQLERQTFEAMCVDQPEIAIRVIQRLAARMIQLEQRLAALGADDMLRPVVRVLVRRAQRGRAAASRPAARARRRGGVRWSRRTARPPADGRRLLRLSERAQINDLEALSAASTR
jgi:thiol-disulfide isomerase/thioredoxin